MLIMNNSKPYIRKDGRFECRIYMGKDAAGKPSYKSIYGKTREEALRKRREFVNCRENISPYNGNVRCRFGFAAIAEEWLSWKCVDIKLSTWANYRMKLDVHIIPYYKDRNISDIEPKTIYDLMAEKRRAGLSGRYISNILIVLKAIFRYAARTYGIKNVFDQISIPKRHRSDVNILSDSAPKRLVKLLINTRDRRDIAVLLAVYTGMRIGELCGLKCSDINLDMKLIYVNRYM